MVNATQTLLQKTCTIPDSGMMDIIVSYMHTNKWAVIVHYGIILITFLIFGAFNDNFSKGTYWVALILITLAFVVGEIFFIGMMFH